MIISFYIYILLRFIVGFFNFINLIEIFIQKLHLVINLYDKVILYKYLIISIRIIFFMLSKGLILNFSNIILLTKSISFYSHYFNYSILKYLVLDKIHSQYLNNMLKIKNKNEIHSILLFYIYEYYSYL